MKRVTFCRLRPAPPDVSEAWAHTRRRAGATVAEFESFDGEARASVLAGGLVPVAGVAPIEPLAWVVNPAEALELEAAGRPGWRITVVDDGPREPLLDSLVRSQAAFLRARRSKIRAAARLCRLPGISARVSVFVDSVEQARVAVAGGAGDLLLRDWDTESIGALRDSLAGYELVERSAIPPGLEIDHLRAELSRELFTAYLHQVDGGGSVRPRYEWAPGKADSPRVPDNRISLQWNDRAWINGSPGGDIPSDIADILAAAREGHRPSRSQVERLFTATGDAVDAVAATADSIRRRVNGDIVTYVINRNINYTNQCYFRCGFCAFSKGPRSLNLRGEPYLLSLDEVVERSREAWERGATEVTLQGGIHPEFTGDFYVHVTEMIKAAVPDMHIHGFTPLEVWQGAETCGVPVEDFLVRLKDAGLGSLPGTAAEVLDDAVRRFLCPDKIRTAEWAYVMITAHELGLRSTSTLMFGHIDHPRAWANHFEVLRSIQERTGGITEFVPLPFVHMGAPIFLQGKSRPGPTWDEVVLVHAIARIAFQGLIDNIQASWVKLGLEGGSRLLAAGCNDMGGTLMDENISRAAGAAHGQLATPDELEGAIRSMARTPARRNTLYELIETPVQHEHP